MERENNNIAPLFHLGFHYASPFLKGLVDAPTATIAFGLNRISRECGVNVIDELSSSLDYMPFIIFMACRRFF
jgi:hypothetical protein